MLKERPQLWKRRFTTGNQDAHKLETISDEERKLSRQDALRRRLGHFSSKSEPLSLWSHVTGSLVVGQEFVLCCLVLTRHHMAILRQSDKGDDSVNIVWLAEREATSMLTVSATLLVILLLSGRTRTSWTKTKTRIKDTVLLAVFLRVLAAVLRTLTAAYSSDTLYALATTGLLLHLLLCDYSYANGANAFKQDVETVKENGRSAFLGGTMSLNAALFSTVMLSSRLEDNFTAYIFLVSSVILFCFYPSARNRLSATQPKILNGFITAGLAFSTWILLESGLERTLFGLSIVTICLVVPCWKCWVLQHQKVQIRGPWDIARPVINTTVS